MHSRYPIFPCKPLSALPKELMLCKMEVPPRQESLLKGPGSASQVSRIQKGIVGIIQRKKN
jgi:hypothetical protein